MPFTNATLKTKLMLIVIVTCTVALLLAGGIFFTYEFVTFRRALFQHTSTLAQITADNCNAALAFNDEKSAKETLSALNADPQILRATLLSANNKILANYKRAGVDVDFVSELQTESSFDAGLLVVQAPVVLDDKRIGTLQIVASADEMYARLWLYAVIVALVVILSILVAMGISARWQRLVIQPILSLTDMAKRISTEKNFKLRAPRESSDEVGVLTDSFNQMLTQIQERDDALLRAHEELKRRVSEAERLQKQASFLAEASGVLASSLDYDATLHSVAELAIPDFADWCIVDVLGNEPTVRSVAVAAANPEKKRLLLDLREKYPLSRTSPHPAAHALREQKPLLLDFDTQSLRDFCKDDTHFHLISALEPRSVIAAPLIARQTVIGAITFATSESHHHYSQSDLAIAEEVARRCALAVDNARLFFEAQEARRSAEEANRAKDEFLATLSHELRTPLTPILSWTRMLRTRKYDEVKFAHGLEVIDRNVKVQAQLIEDILDVSRIIAGKLHLSFEPVDLKSVITAALETVRPNAEKKGLNIELASQGKDSPVQGDPHRLQQVVWNLLSNAVKFTPSGGHVRLSLEQDDAGATITVSDDGEGIPQQFLPSLFERFKQADSSSTRAHGGLGLGLAIVKHIVERHSGTVEARSEGKNKGSTFTVRLPLLAATTPINESGKLRLQSNKLNPLLLKDLRLVVVDDDADAREVLRSLLEEHGAQVRVAGTSREAIQLLESGGTDVLLTDLAMPDEDGFALLQNVREMDRGKSRQLPAIALTASAREQDRAKSLQAGFDYHLSKPIEPERLVLTVAHLAGR